MCWPTDKGLFETREQAKRGVMAGLVITAVNGHDNSAEKIDTQEQSYAKVRNSRYVSQGAASS